MKKVVASVFAMVAVGALSVGCGAGPEVEGLDGDDDTSATDALGVDLAAVGLAAGDRPCGDAREVAAVVDEDGRYLAFCASPLGETMVVQITPGDVAPIGSGTGCALETYLEATPESAAVPQALVDACGRTSAGTRGVSATPVLVGPAGGPGALVISGPSSCTSSTYFSGVHCGAIDDYTANPGVMDSISWCGLGPYSGNAQRTASTQGLPDALEGRMTVAACGTSTTNLKGLVKKPVSGAWVAPAGANLTLSPNYTATIEIHTYDVSETSGLDTYYGDDLRFTVTPSSGAWYRYTGAYIEYFPIP